MSDHDRLGQREFLRRSGLGRSLTHTVWHNGTEYDSMAILGVAYLHATGQPATSDEFSGGEAGAAKVLAGLGFDVVVDEHAAAQQPAQKQAAPKPKRRPSDKPVDVCPTCHMALPVTGVCDTAVEKWRRDQSGR